MISLCRKIATFVVILSLLTFPAEDREEEMAFISHKVSVISLLSLFAMSLLVYCATANNKTNQPSYKMVSDNYCKRSFLTRVKTITLCARSGDES